MPGRPDMLAAVEAPADADEVMGRLKRAVFKSRCRVDDFFTDFDPLRTGFVTQHKFRIALMESGAMAINDKEMTVR